MTPNMPSPRPTFRRYGLCCAVALITLLGAACGGSDSSGGGGSGSIGHVFVIVLENKSYDTTFGSGSAAPYLATTLPAQGALLTNYYGIGHNSLGNYIAMISGQGPNRSTQLDCPYYHDFAMVGDLNGDGQAVGQGCVYPTAVPSLPDQFKTAGLSWKAYMEDMGNDPSRYDPANADPTTCGHPPLPGLDKTQSATATDQYATRHNPFMYFHSVIDDAAGCAAQVVNLSALPADLASAERTPGFVFIAPNLCNDAHDTKCKNGDPGGLTSADTFLQKWVPQILDSPAYKRDGLLVITFDESDGAREDSTACCGEDAGPNAAKPGLKGPGGGRTGTVLLSPFIKGGTVADKSYNHYSLLRSVELIFGLPYLGYAARGDTAPDTACDNSSQPCAFGADVFTANMPSFPARP
jgi:hypothetical protein